MKFEIYLYTPNKIEAFYKKAIAEYDKRLGRYGKIALHTVRKEKEWMKLLSEAKEGYYVMPGTSLSSEELSEQIAAWEGERRKEVSFYIGGHGEEEMDLALLEPGLLEAFSVSDFEINGNMLAMILYEQIYRGYRILNHHPYHK